MNIETLIDALDSVTWYNGLAATIRGWTELEPSKQTGCILCPECCWKDEQLQVFWMIAVFMFGNYGTSPRSGWIEDVEGFREFCRIVTFTLGEELEQLEGGGEE